MYGDMTYNFDYYIKVLSFKVYSNETKERTVELFSVNADGHIEPDIIAGLLSVGDDTIQSVQSTRDYLVNESEWNSSMNTISLFDIDADNTNETTLQSGVYPSTKTTLTPLGDGKLFMTFIGDVESRSDVNRTGLFYSIYNGIEWSELCLVDDDGTLDDYPDVFDLGDKLLISWSSADKVLEDDVTTQQALTALDIKTVFFDKASESFGEVMQLTHTTNEDYTADVEPKAAYDSEKNRLILYYTKTEYVDAQTLTDLTNAPSVIAYRFYENGAWNDESSYTDEELSGVEEKDAYKSNWYGQRFLDIRLDKTSGEMLRIIDSDAISYNGLALYAWTVDYDRDLNTVDDRDIFIQIYNFGENSFTHIIKMTPYSGAYQTPKFCRYNDETFLFYSSLGKLGEGEDEEESGIAYFEVSDIISNNKYTLVNENNVEYYKLEYTAMSEQTTSADGTVIPAMEQNVQIMPSYAVKTNGYVNNYCVDIDEDERMYLTWTNSDNDGSMQVYTSIFDSAPISEAKPDEDGEASLDTDWSEAFKLTDAENISYRNSDAAVMDGKLYIASSKTPYVTDGDSKSLDDTNASLVMLVHTPYSKAVTVGENELAADTDYIYPSTEFTLTSTVKNEGTKFIDSPVTFRFTMTSNGTVTELGTNTVEDVWGAGKTLSSSVNVPALDEISDDLTFNAEITVGNDTTNTIRQEMKAVKEYRLTSEGEAAFIESTDGHFMSIPLNNKGNIASPEIAIKLYTAKDGSKDELIDEFTIDSLAANTSTTIEENVQIPDSAFDIDGSDGTADIIVEIQADGKDVDTLETTAHKIFDSTAIETMSKVTDVSINGSDKIYAKYLEDINIETEIEGTAGDEVQVIWKSDNSDVVYVRADNTLFAVGNGTAQLTGYVVPAVQNIVFNYDGTATQGDVLKTIPSTLYKTVTANVTVNSTGTSSSSGGGGGGSSTTTKTETNEDGSTTTTKTDSKGTVTETTKYTDGSTKVVETKKDGTVTTTSTTKEGVVVKSEANAEGKVTSMDATVPATVTDELVELPVTVAPENLANAETISIKVEGEGTKEVAIPVENPDEGIVVYAINADGTETIVKNAYVSDGAVVVDVEGNANIKLARNTKTFTDVLDTDWFAAPVNFVAAREIFNGTDEGIFAPDSSMTRGMLAKVLHNLENNPEATSENVFSDADGHWAEDSVAWAAEKGIVSGYEDGTFGVDDEITREQLATMLYRYAGSPEVTGNLDKYTDKTGVSDYAEKAVIWAVEVGIISGTTETTLDAKGLATRAQVATMIMRFIQNI